MTPRQQSILDILQSNSQASVDELVKLLGISEATVRRDLSALASEGLINRIWGGAVPATSVAFGALVNERSNQQMIEKKAIASVAVDLINDGEVIAIDVGTTCMELAKCLLISQLKRLTIFTNSLLVAQILGTADYSVYLIGGELRKDEYSLVGPVARENAIHFNFDKYFLGVSGFDLENGPTDFNLQDVEIKRVLLSRTKETIALVDHTKFSRTSLASICESRELQTIITDSRVSTDTIIGLESQGLNVIIAPV